MKISVRGALDKAKKIFQAAKIDNPDYDARELLAHVLCVDKMKLSLMYSHSIDEDKCEKFFSLVDRRLEYEPLQYITEKAYLMGHEFFVDQNVLIPRHDTETLILEACEIIKEKGHDTVLDLCTGSGAIGISIAKSIPEIKVTCSDISNEALSVAKKNAISLDAEKNITFVSGDLFTPFKNNQRDKRMEKKKGNACDGYDKFSMIVSNPPYIRHDEIEELDKEVSVYEPLLALDGGSDGLDCYKRIVSEAPMYLEKNGYLVLEIGHDQKKPVLALLEESGMYSKIYSKQDLANRDRVIVAIRR